MPTTRKRNVKEKSPSPMASRRASNAPVSSRRPSEGPSSNNSKELLVNQAAKTKWQGWWIRVFWSFAMVGGFCGIIAGGHLYLILFVLFIQFMCFKEIITIAFAHSSALKNTDGSDKTSKKELPLFRSLNWYFLFCGNYFFYAQPLTRKGLEKLHQWFLQDGFGGKESDELNQQLTAHHNFISFLFYITGFVVFVLTLKKGHYRFQFSQFGWTHVTCLVVVTSSYFVVCNIFEGLIWFLFPVFIIICNDCTAYIFGFFFGRTQLISLSPKKTWEGFLGALFSTMVFGLVSSYVFAQFDYMICPILEPPSIYPVIFTLKCRAGDVFLPKLYSLPFVPSVQLSLYPIQLHGIVLSAFGSIIAPFGGFFASGFKRAFGIKDFGDLIPGHGGVMDRFDCQFLMLTFVNVYFSAFISTNRTSTFGFSNVADTLKHLSPERQDEIFALLQEQIKNRG